MKEMIKKNILKNYFKNKILSLNFIDQKNIIIQKEDV